MGIFGGIFGILPHTVQEVGIRGHLIVVQTWRESRKTLSRESKDAAKGKFGGEREKNSGQKGPKTTLTGFVYF